MGPRRSVWAITDTGANFVSTAESIIGIAIVQNDQKLFSTVPADKIIRTRGLEQTASDFAKDLIADQMAVGVVYPLEMVDVAKKQHSAGVFAL